MMPRLICLALCLATIGCGGSESQEDSQPETTTQSSGLDEQGSEGTDSTKPASDTGAGDVAQEAAIAETSSNDASNAPSAESADSPERPGKAGQQEDTELLQELAEVRGRLEEDERVSREFAIKFGQLDKATQDQVKEIGRRGLNSVEEAAFLLRLFPDSKLAQDYLKERGLTLDDVEAKRGPKSIEQATARLRLFPNDPVVRQYLVSQGQDPDAILVQSMKQAIIEKEKKRTQKNAVNNFKASAVERRNEAERDLKTAEKALKDRTYKKSRSRQRSEVKRLRAVLEEAQKYVDQVEAGEVLPPDEFYRAEGSVITIPIEVGDFGLIPSADVLQITGPMEFHGIARTLPGDSSSRVIFRGFGLNGRSEGEEVNLGTACIVTKLETYEIAGGTNTVPVIEPFPEIERIVVKPNP